MRDCVGRDRRRCWHHVDIINMETKALATAEEIAHMWGSSREQFVTRIQVAVLDAMRWAKEGCDE